MIEHIWLYTLLPSIVAALCLCLLARLINKGADKPFIHLFTNLFIINACQVLGYCLFAVNRQLGEIGADIYLISTYFFFTHLVMMAVYHMREKVFPAINLLYIAPIALTAMHISGLIVESYRIEQNTLMHNDGEYAWLNDIHSMLSCITVLGIFLYNIQSIKNNRTLKSKNLLALISILPLVLIVMGLIYLSTTSHAISVTIIVPLVTFYTACVFFYLSNKCVVDLSIGLRFLKGRLRLAVMIFETGRTKEDIKQFNKALDKQFIIESLEYNDHNIQETAKYQRINHTTLRNKIKDYEITLPN